jgi:signal transduction histidine kinase
MMSSSFTLLGICLGVLALLFIYTMWLMRSGRLNAHVTVRWILAEGAAFLAVSLWQWLPMFGFTSTLGDRELLMVLAVVFFALVGFLILDSLVSISTHTHQVKLLTQEVALLRERAERERHGS